MKLEKIIKIIILLSAGGLSAAHAVIIPVTGKSLIAIAATNTAILATNASMIPFIKASADNTGLIYLQTVKSNQRLEKINKNIEKNRIKNEMGHLIHTMFGKEKLTGNKWEYIKDDTTVKVEEANFGGAITDLKNHFQRSDQHVAYNIDQVYFNSKLYDLSVKSEQEKAGVKGLEKEVFDNVKFEVDAFKKLVHIKDNYLDHLDKNSRINDYIAELDNTISLKGSVDLGNLLLSELIVQQKFLLEIETNSQIIDNYNKLRTESTNINVRNSTGKLRKL